MDEKDFELIAILGETGNITKAADRLYITQSALSKRIKAIEKDLGMQLLLRSRQGIRFTPEGEAVLNGCRKAADVLETMRKDIITGKGEVRGTLRAGISLNYAQYTLPDKLALYHQRFPDVHLNITTGQSSQLFQKLQEGAFDVAIIRGEFPWDGFHYLLSQEKICLVYDPKYRGTTLNDFMYIGRKTDPLHSAQISRWMYEHNVTPPSAGIRMDSITTCMELVKRGLGWSLLPEIVLDDYPGVILPCTFQDGEPFVRRTRLLMTLDGEKLPQVAAFCQVIRGNIV